MQVNNDVYLFIFILDAFRIEKFLVELLSVSF